MKHLNWIMLGFWLVAAGSYFYLLFVAYYLMLNA